MEYFKDDKETDCVDIQTESHRYNKNINDNETLMNIDQKNSADKRLRWIQNLGSF